MLAECAKRPLVTVVILLSVLVLYKALILLIDRIVCQMHVLVLFVDLLGVSL